MFEITGLKSSTGPLTKHISMADNGALISDGSACVMGRGTAARVRLPDLAQFANLIGRLATNEAIALGSLREDLPDKVEITTARQLAELNGQAPPDLISRTAGHIGYVAKQPSLVLLDYDTKGMPSAVADRVQNAGGFWSGLVSACHSLGDAARVTRRSTSSGISRADTGQPIKGSDGIHVFVLVNDGADAERFLRTLHERCWLKGFGWMMVGAGGQLLERSIVDRMVYAAERLVFEGAPILAAPLVQDQTLRAPVAVGGDQVDTHSACPSLTVVELATLRDLRAAERHRLGVPAAEARGAFIREQANRIVVRAGGSLMQATRAAEQQCGGVLLSPVVLPFDAAALAGVTVSDVLANPDRFDGATLADPLEGVPYGRCKAKIMRRSDGSLWVNSFAHGRTTYELKHDAASVEALLAKAHPTEVTDMFVRLLPVADLAADDEQRLREIVRGAAGIKARPLDAKIKAARAEHERQRTRAEAERKAASRTDRRPQLQAPLPDAERLPVMAMLDDVLSASNQPVPPLRNLDGRPVEVRCRPPMMLHELTSDGSNQDKPMKTRLPAPVLPLLTLHDRCTLAHEIERHVEFIVEGPEGACRPVALPGVFLEHFVAYRDSRLPRVGAIVTAPLVMPDGTLLAPDGLDQARKLVFQIEPQLMRMMPAEDERTKTATASALDFLVTQWLADVATDFSGKCVLIAMALTIIERVLLPERPAFFITAGKRGGGKTTAVMMLILAVTGKKPAAAAWSPNEEERRKAVLAYLAEGLAAMVWDNIPLGTAIACPTLEKVLTAESYSDRILGQSTTVTVPAFTVMSFTGNNIGPKGDMASRSLIARLTVSRPDPENRHFKHADPVAWTLENRGAILRALYTILLANPQLRLGQRKEAKTRFKVWWSLVGAALEHAALALVEDQFPITEADRYASQIDFTKLFAAVECEDEDGAEIAQVLDIIHMTWGTQAFQASDLAKLANDPMEGEGDTALALKGYFEPNGRRSTSALSARVVGYRLGAMVGAPLLVGEKTLRLDRITSDEQRKQRRVQSFAVRVM